MATVEPLFRSGPTIEVKHEKDFRWSRRVDVRWLNRLATMTTAEAQGYGYRGWGYGGWGLGLGAFAAGAVIGSALASPYYGYAPAYNYAYAPVYSYGYAPGYNYGYRRAYYGPMVRLCC